MTPDEADDDRVPPGIVLDLDEAFRVLEALEDARLTLRETQAALALQDELATVIRYSTVGSGLTKEAFDDGLQRTPPR